MNVLVAEDSDALRTLIEKIITVQGFGMYSNQW